MTTPKTSPEATQSASPSEENYYFGEIKEYSLDRIESELLNESVYLDVFAGSDSRFKRNIKSLGTTLNKLTHLEAVSWDWKTESFPNKNLETQTPVGFIAQDVQKVFPNLVKQDEDGLLMVNYSKIPVLLVQAVNELNSKLIAQEQELKDLKKQIAALKK